MITGLEIICRERKRARARILHTVFATALRRLFFFYLRTYLNWPPYPVHTFLSAYATISAAHVSNGGSLRFQNSFSPGIKNK